MNLIEFWTICSVNGIILNKQQISLIERYTRELLFWNKKVNLISRKDEQWILNKHILHSLSVLKYIEIKSKARCLDVGTGGGLPGIPLKIARQDLFMMLIDSVNKKIKISDMMVNHTELRNINTMNIRAEKLSDKKEFKEYFDYIFIRAVKRIDEVLSWVSKLAKNDALIVFYKGGDITEEIKKAKRIFPQVGFEIKNIDIIGDDSFRLNDKKIVVCKLN
jgi:16S rRNA (guanine527-N7)-methyltransferase